jgi:hypothetical protein
MPRKIMATLDAIAALGMVTVASSPADARGGFGFRGSGWGPGTALGLAGLGIGLGVANAYGYYGGYATHTWDTAIQHPTMDMATQLITADTVTTATGRAETATAVWAIGATAIKAGYNYG